MILLKQKESEAMASWAAFSFLCTRQCQSPGTSHLETPEGNLESLHLPVSSLSLGCFAFLLVDTQAGHSVGFLGLDAKLNLQRKGDEGRRGSPGRMSLNCR